MKYGKIIDGKLQYAGNIINTDKGFISNPTNEQLIANGYKEIEYTEKPTYDKDNEKLVETYTEQDKIIIGYEKITLTEEEKRENLINKVIDLEQKYNMCRWEREIILTDNSGASDYTKTKAQEIEDLSAGLRNNENNVIEE